VEDELCLEYHYVQEPAFQQSWLATIQDDQVVMKDAMEIKNNRKGTNNHSLEKCK